MILFSFFFFFFAVSWVLILLFHFSLTVQVTRYKDLFCFHAYCNHDIKHKTVPNQTLILFSKHHLFSTLGSMRTLKCSSWNASSRLACSQDPSGSKSLVPPRWGTDRFSFLRHWNNSLALKITQSNSLLTTATAHGHVLSCMCWLAILPKTFSKCPTGIVSAMKTSMYY